MKKNTMMRIASFLLIAVLLSTSAISGTYAKYVTMDKGADKARVAKFGVAVEIDDKSGFNTEYATDDTSRYSGTVSVKSSSDEKVVAPGTSSDDVNGGVTFKITGTPEVATQVDIVFEVKSDIYLGTGEYGDPTTADTTDTFEVTTPYYPVVFTLKDSANNVVATGNLATIASAINAKSNKYEPNKTLDETYTLTWAWEYGGFDGVTYEDRCDTMLGNLAAKDGWNYTEVAENNFSTVLEYALSITVTQID